MIDSTILADVLASRAPKLQWDLASTSQFQGQRTAIETPLLCPQCHTCKVVCCHVVSTLPSEYIDEFCHICLNQGCDYAEYSESSTGIEAETACPFCHRVTCLACGSPQVICSPDYYTTGGDMEHVQWQHTCRDCGHIQESDVQMACYGYVNDYTCPLPNCRNTYRS